MKHSPRRRDDAVSADFRCRKACVSLLNEGKVIVHNHQEDSEGDLRYEQILAVRQNPRLYLLELPGKTALLLEKTAFTKGALEEFPAFMRRKCPGRVAF